MKQKNGMNMLKLTRATFVVATTLTVGLAQADGAKYNTADYAAQDHLLAQWDGIENAGRGVRDEQAQTWVDLTGNHDDFVFPNGPVRLGGNCYNTVATSSARITAAISTAVRTSRTRFAIPASSLRLRSSATSRLPPTARW